MNLADLQYIRSNQEGLFFLIAGPCVVENEEITLHTATILKSITDSLSIPFIFKASYRKANRSKADSYTGPGDEKGLEILQKIKESLKVPIVTDIHSPAEAALAASYGVDILQIPAFLCRQSDLLEAAAKTGKYVNIKKGQFLSPGAMKFAAEKISKAGNNKIMLTGDASVKTEKIILEEKGKYLATPKDCLKEAFNLGIISDADNFLKMLNIVIERF